MTNKEIANTFSDLAKIMELHGENKFKIRSYSNAYVQLRKVDGSLFDMTPEEIIEIKGVGKAIADKIQELKNTGTITNLELYRDKTPPGIIKMLRIKGFGPKKISTIWNDMGIETLGELLYACNENRLIELKGFGTKTQEDLRKSIEFFLKSEHKYRYADIIDTSDEILQLLRSNGQKAEATGPLFRKDNIIEVINYVFEGSKDELGQIEKLEVTGQEGDVVLATYQELYPIRIHLAGAENFDDIHFETSFSEDLKQLGASKESVLSALDLKSLAPEMQSLTQAHFDLVSDLGSNLIDLKDIKGVVHAHSTYSDGIHSLKEMVEGAKSRGYEYLVISDHSKSAFYAGGLKEDELRQQWAEIDQLNSEMDDFKIFKSIESDILNDGSLDYEQEILDEFDLVIASVHSNLKMDETKATNRLVNAIEHRSTTILGHPTGRLILSRRGYPIDHQKIIDACAANGVCIELNANPFRLDLDWEWIPYAMSKDVLISINPDAHSVNGIDHIKWGVISARKGGLNVKSCLNALNLEKFERFLQTERK